MNSLLDSISAYVEDTTIASNLPGLDEPSVSAIMRNFSNCLGALVFPQYDRIGDAELRDQAWNRTAQILAGAHAKVYDFIMKESHGYKNPTDVAYRTPAQIRTLLEIWKDTNECH